MLVDITAAEEVTDWSSNKLILVVSAALLGFFSGYVLELIKTRRTPRAVLSWDLRIDEPELGYGGDESTRIKISYLGREVSHLVTVRCTVTNTGNTSIKDQFVRFKIPPNAELLRRELDPVPEPEIGVMDLTDENPAFMGPRYKIGQLDRGESVSFAFAADGGSWRTRTGIVFRNENDVVYQRRDTAQARDDQQHIAPFLFGLAVIGILTALTGAASLAIWIIGKFYLTEIAYFVIIIALTLLLAGAAAYLLTHARRAVRAIAATLAGAGRPGPSLTINGTSSWVAYAPDGVIRVKTPAADSPSE